MKSYYKHIPVLFRSTDGSPLDVYEDNENFRIRGLICEGNWFVEETYFYNKKLMSFCGPVCLEHKIYSIHMSFPLSSFYRLVEVGLLSYSENTKRYWV